MTEHEDELAHYGTLHKSGRYPWGSGGNPEQRNKSFLAYVQGLEAKGMTQTEIAKGLGMSSTELRSRKSIAKGEQRKEMAREAVKLKNKNMSNIAIGNQMGINESQVRALLNPSLQEKVDIYKTTANMLKENVAKKGFLDIGAGTEQYIGISKEKLNTAANLLVDEGYRIDTIKVPQLGTNKETTLKVLSPPGTTYGDVTRNRDKIGSIANYTEDGGRTFPKIEAPKSVDSKRVGVRYAEDGGTAKDGVIELRRNVDDISLGKARYAQVRVMVDGTHYLKGMAMYSDNMPPGVDLMFNTNKSDTGSKLDAMKPIKSDKDLPFGSVVRQKHYTDANGKDHLSVLNIVGVKDTSGEEGGWSTWSKNLSSQMLSKQTPHLAKQQLGLGFDIKKSEFDEINSLTNPTVKKLLLEKFADGADSSAVKLKAAGLPRTANHVILPINSLKDHEIYAPNYRNGEKVVLIRHPHGGIFEIPELTVNNRNKEANSLIKNAKDAVGITSKVAERLSGADFDGDTVLVIPQAASGPRRIQTSSPLMGLKNFDSKVYKLPDSAPKMSEKTKQHQMGDVSNLITDMTIKKAPPSEIARAVRHSMVVIDAEKHHLDYKQSAKDNNIRELKAKYQKKPNGRVGGASTLISKASSETQVLDRKPRSAKDGGPIDPITGQKVYTYTGKSYVNAQGKTVMNGFKSTKMAEVSNAFDLSSGTPMESVYAEHANKLKALANEARKTALSTRGIPQSKSANTVYKSEVQSLQAKLNVALKNAPLERQAQLLANTMVSAKRQANPDMEKDELKKIKGVALTAARARTGASKIKVDITNREWEAIQAGAISNHMLTKILDNADLDKVKTLATPRLATVMVPSKLSQAKRMLDSGHTQAEVADALGVPVSTLTSALG